MLILILLCHLCSGPPNGHVFSVFPISELYEIFSCLMHTTHPLQGLHTHTHIYIYIYFICVCVCVWCVCVCVCVPTSRMHC